MLIAPFVPAFDKLSAINAVLDAMGQSGISSLNEIDFHVDAGSINGYLDRYSASCQANGGKGYWFNKEEFHKLGPAPDTGRVVVPNNTLAVRMHHQPRNREVTLSIRGKHLIDLKEYGFDLRPLADPNTGLIPLDIIAFIDFDDLPQTAKDAIVDAVRFWYVHDKDVDQAKFNALNQQAQRSMISLQLEDSSHKKRNAFTNPHLRHPIAMIGGLSNN
ncbi:tail tubular protein A [Pseudomonas phage Njord]|uniref:Tail tubular protein A n=1 Tax=Pseudomonas phage Njord TaxID=2163985 RepID=A0A2S1GMK1_9CAUD|nr:tail tubular protein A [Pseudomonas phage Njord]AWD90618.1 tail tubular protein A [Pseudomonas phage Njord]